MTGWSNAGGGRQLVYGDTNGTATVLGLDNLAGEHPLIIMDLVHHKIHEGDTFQAGYLVPDGSPIADNANIDVGLTTGTRGVHAMGAADFGGDAEAHLYEAPTFTGGTAVAAYNKLRTSAGTASVDVVHTPTVTNVGTAIESAFMLGGSGPQALGSSRGQRNEWVLKPSTKYLYRITNRSGQAQPGSLNIEWYEQG